MPNFTRRLATALIAVALLVCASAVPTTAAAAPVSDSLGHAALGDFSSIRLGEGSAEPTPTPAMVSPERPSAGLAATGSGWEARFAMLAFAGLTVIVGVVAIVARLDMRSRRGERG